MSAATSTPRPAEWAVHVPMRMERAASLRHPGLALLALAVGQNTDVALHHWFLALPSPSPAHQQCVVFAKWLRAVSPYEDMNTPSTATVPQKVLHTLVDQGHVPTTHVRTVGMALFLQSLLPADPHYDGYPAAHVTKYATASESTAAMAQELILDFTNQLAGRNLVDRPHQLPAVLASAVVDPALLGLTPAPHTTGVQRCLFYTYPRTSVLAFAVPSLLDRSTVQDRMAMAAHALDTHHTSTQPLTAQHAAAHPSATQHAAAKPPTAQPAAAQNTNVHLSERATKEAVHAPSLLLRRAWELLTPSMFASPVCPPSTSPPPVWQLRHIRLLHNRLQNDALLKTQYETLLIRLLRTVPSLEMATAAERSTVFMWEYLRTRTKEAAMLLELSTCVIEAASCGRMYTEMRDIDANVCECHDLLRWTGRDEHPVLRGHPVRAPAHYVGALSACCAPDAEGANDSAPSTRAAHAHGPAACLTVYIEPTATGMQAAHVCSGVRWAAMADGSVHMM